MDLRDHRVCLENQVLLEPSKELKAVLTSCVQPTVPQDKRGHKACRDLRVTKDVQVHLESQGGLEQRVRKVMLEYLASKASQALEVHRASEVILGHLDLRGRRVPLDIKE